MVLDDLIPGATVYHSPEGHFSDALTRALRKETIAFALGPIYDEDPADRIVAPLIRSITEGRWSIETTPLADEATTRRIQMLRVTKARDWLAERPWAPPVLNEWARAGLVLEIASRWGINHLRLGRVNPRWKLKGTVTGRFGYVPPRFGPPLNPMTIAADDRKNIVPAGDGRQICSLDFRGMDLWSMVSLVPGLESKYDGCSDPHMRTAEILFESPGPEERAAVKQEIFVHAYGGQSYLRDAFERLLPELNWLRQMPHGQGARLVQAQSAQAFRAALSNALPHLVHDHVRPMFTVHDELVLDVKMGSAVFLEEVVTALEEGARKRVGQPYRVARCFGHTYGEVKT